ncbi:coiled-coil domain-containing protein 103 [Helicoverpa armigera]|uniref:Dynein attachment factor N-terminal domain-containing protein n=1 Tax=Helicoverpa armigera TaxID=29058 RepID=A0A2W1BM14_HELAM|nr:hypothetical protein B5X24_HaOG207373 [Helicoverpa armigera]
MEPLTQDDFKAMEVQLKTSVELDNMYWKVNSVKCDAIQTAKTYEEFADRVAAAHLDPLGHSDFKKKCTRKWNEYSTQRRSPDDEFDSEDDDKR